MTLQKQSVTVVLARQVSGSASSGPIGSARRGKNLDSSYLTDRRSARYAIVSSRLTTSAYFMCTSNKVTL